MQLIPLTIIAALAKKIMISHIFSLFLSFYLCRSHLRADLRARACVRVSEALGSDSPIAKTNSLTTIYLGMTRNHLGQCQKRPAQPRPQQSRRASDV